MHYGGITMSLGKAFRPQSDSEIRMERRFLHPAEQEEIKRRVEVYAKQAEEQGYLTWLPRRGSGRSACNEMSASVECVAESAA